MVINMSTVGIIVLIAAISVVIYFTINPIEENKWMCTESGCEFVSGGNHDTEEECKKACNKGVYKKSVKFAR
jgi:hypothetical protein